MNGVVQKKIIYVDDINFHLLAAKSRLEKQYEIYPARSYEELNDLLEHIKPDLILLDINMPEINGFEILEKLKANPRFCEIPVMILSARDDRESILKAMKLGAVDFIIKPYSDSGLIDAIEYHLDFRKHNTIKPIILAIDDDPSILQSLNYLLSDSYTVYTIPGVKEEKILTELLKKFTPDLFILDCNMPGLSGFDIVSVVRGISLYEETPIIFLTSEGDMDTIFVAFNQGACDFMVKPVDKLILQEKVAEHLKFFIVRRRMR
ncbi:MAG: response regulator [Lachnospiraceae bacterium]|nr:response regulator [Lachnospiraceae bacterium]